MKRGKDLQGREGLFLMGKSFWGKEKRKYLCRKLDFCKMVTMQYTEERNMLEAYSSVLNNLSVSSKLELMERLLKSLKTEQKETHLVTTEFIPEKSAEQIISEIQNSRCFGKTRVVEPF